MRAEDRARTGHLDLGKVALYQMSYFRINDKNSTYFRIAKIRLVTSTTKILFVFRIVQRVIRHIHLGLALVTVCVKVITSA